MPIFPRPHGWLDVLNRPCLLKIVPIVYNVKEAQSRYLVKKEQISHRTAEKCRETENIAHQ